MKTLRSLKIWTLIISLILLSILLLAYYLFNIDIIIASIIFIILVVFVVIVLSVLTNTNNEDINHIVKELNDSTSLALKEMKLGVIVYNKDFNISYMSDMFIKKHLDHNGEKLLTWLPELEDLINGSSDKQLIIINDDKFEVTKKTNSYTLIFKDISLEYDLQKKIKDDSYVLGLCNFDNYDEDEESEDVVTYINANIKLPVMEYFKEYGIAYRTLRNNRLQLILNYSKYEALLKDKFSILNTVRREAKKAELDISLSMAFAYGYPDLAELDDETSNLLELAQTRGGDQVVVREFNKEAIFYGGSSEAREKRSKVKVRVMANTMKRLISNASNVIIVGHEFADSDCIGSMLGMASISKNINKETYVILDSIEIEPMSKDALDNYSDDIRKEFNVIFENEALIKMNENTLVIMCDHHSLDQSNSKNVLKQAKQVVIVDHHRRKADLDVNAVLMYVEASASSTCEIVSEMFNYIPRIVISDVVANFMYLGIVIDTNHFRVRSGSRTFDSVKLLKDLGADAALTEKLIQEPYENVKKRVNIISNASLYSKDIIISCVEEGEYPRSIASQACDALIETKEIEAAFVICYSTSDETIITARSKGKINVQAILEKMKGGGHMTAAGLQRKNVLVSDLKAELVEELEDYLKESEDESNIA